MTKDTLIDKLTKHQLNSILKKIEPELRDTIRIYPIAGEEKDIHIGQTKIGGKPDLSETQVWPTESVVEKKKRFWLFGKSTEEIRVETLAFIAQINLEEIAPFDTENVLPEKGILYFFYWVYSDICKVIFYEKNVKALKRTDFPEDLKETSKFKASAIQVAKEISFPYMESKVYNKFTDQEQDKFWGKINEEIIINKLLGYSDNIQGEMESECEGVFNHSEGDELERIAKNWILLLQIDSNEENKMMWGDCGRLYFWIRREDLINRRFENVKVVVQCH
ncbi:YwqG family protein [Emticicia agri]|uniref:DUF1963 domain-containing protein n=1 Tax=Emticicia agri TaxID=2492393 RepID=A0A4Q5LU40_9BACT|nr:YwqG family protein [Emticicia agri]RYU93112.1 DUF1963 domain-containing protein [Emticicia agri]